ncbi:MAG: MFS transporter, partial [Pseudomonadota bacterium]
MASEIDEAPNLSLGKAEFVVLIASLMALNALAIDVMLPALSQIGADFQLTNENDRQLVIIAYV